MVFIHKIERSVFKNRPFLFLLDLDFNWLDFVRDKKMIFTLTCARSKLN